MRKQSILFLLPVALLFCFVSCGNNNEEDLYIPIKSVRVTSSTSLDRRANWEFYVNNNLYKSTVNGRTIHAQPKSEQEITHSIIYADNGKASSSSSFNKTNPVLISFVSPNYPFKENVIPKARVENGSAIPEMLDQSTLDKMLTMDAISAYYTCMVTSHIENVKLAHNHCLIDYTFEGLPEGAETQLFTTSAAMKPLVVDGVHKAILANPLLVSLQVKVGEAVHVLSLGLYIKKLPIEMRISKDVYYNFVVKYDAESDTDKVLTIENLTAQKWSEQELEEEKQIAF